MVFSLNVFTQSRMALIISSGTTRWVWLLWICVVACGCQFAIPQTATPQTAMPQTAHTPDSSGYLIVSGYVLPKAKSATLVAVFLQQKPNTVSATSGPCIAELRDSNNRLLASEYFTPGLEVQIQATAPSHNQTQPDDLQEFSVSLTWKEAAQALHIKCNNESLVTIQRNPKPPELQWVEPRISSGNAGSVRGTLTLHWQVSGGAKNSPVLGSQLQFSNDNGQSWSPLTPFAPASSATIDTSLLPSGRNQQFRVLASDGLNTVYVTQAMSISNPLGIAATTPAPNSIDNSRHAPIEIRFYTAVNTLTITHDNIKVLDDRRQLVNGTLKYIAETNTIRFTPAKPLELRTQYSVRIERGLSDINGLSMAESYEWPFVTESN